jgi:hypothetical protein
MAIIGFNFTKIAAQRISGRTGKINITNNIGVRNIETSKFSGDDKRSAVKISFRYDGVYDPKVAHLQFDGDVVLLLEKKAADDLVVAWKDGKADTKILTGAMNHVLERCNIQAIILARDMNLPSPVPMPKVNMDAGSVKNATRAKTVSKKAAKSTKKKTKK